MNVETLSTAMKGLLTLLRKEANSALANSCTEGGGAVLRCQ